LAKEKANHKATSDKFTVEKKGLNDKLKKANDDLEKEKAILKLSSDNLKKSNNELAKEKLNH